ncbi:MAG: hypothetical protein EOO42_23340, partial [Flavobacteriales bacterium]
MRKLLHILPATNFSNRLNTTKVQISNRVSFKLALKHLTNYVLGLLTFALLLGSAKQVFADGSINLYPQKANGAANKGGRAKLNSSSTVQASTPYANLGVHYVFAKAGETIALASSAMINSSNGRIRLTLPNGTLYTTASFGVPNSAGLGRISDRAAEVAGPKLNSGDAGANKYTPCTYRVPVGTADGLYKVEFIATGATNQADNTPEDEWTQSTSSSTIAAWDVSVINTNETATIPGRAYANLLTLYS